MKKWDTVAIVGVGLLGGSIGLALQRRKLAAHVIGIGRREESLRRARDHGVVTHTTTDLAVGVASAELVIVCTPVGDIVDHVCAVVEHCPPSTIITDVGSIIANIVGPPQQRLAPRARFVGSHPMAGSEKTGPEHAREDLFEGRVTVVTPVAEAPVANPSDSDTAAPAAYRTSSTDANSLQRVIAFWQSLGSRVICLSPADHDQAVAMTSHATHVIATVLAVATEAEQLPLAASGWQDTTRIAAGDPPLWRQILLGNRQQVLKSLDKFEKVLSQFRTALENGDEESVEQLLHAGKNSRDSVGS